MVVMNLTGEGGGPFQKDTPYKDTVTTTSYETLMKEETLSYLTQSIFHELVGSDTCYLTQIHVEEELSRTECEAFEFELYARLEDKIGNFYGGMAASGRQHSLAKILFGLSLGFLFTSTIAALSGDIQDATFNLAYNTNLGAFALSGLYLQGYAAVLQDECIEGLEHLEIKRHANNTQFTFWDERAKGEEVVKEEWENLSKEILEPQHN